MNERSSSQNPDDVCDEFETAWKDAESPRIEDFLERVSESERSEMLRSLVQIELWWRRDDPLPPASEEYKARFASDVDTINEAFEAYAMETDVNLGGRDGFDDGSPLSPKPDTKVSQLEATQFEVSRIAGVRKHSSNSLDRYFGKYELLEEIARGGMGVVFKARQTKLNRIVALKMILSGHLAGEEEVQRFQLEAEAAANLDHPGIVPIHEIGEHDGQHYFSMGFVDGDSLQRELRDGPFSAKRAATVVQQVSESIAYAHECGVIHRDLKPANVLIDSGGQPKVTDFGLAKQVESDSDLTRTGAVMGTPSFMPPEQAAGKTDLVGTQADVYSLGAILYSLLTGRPPFQAATPIDTLMQVIEREPVAPRSLNPKLPQDLETICLKCLEKEPAKRYESAVALSDELGRYLKGEPILARPVRTHERAIRWCGRNPLVSSLCAAILFLLVGGTVVSMKFAIEANQNAKLAEEKAAEAVGSLVTALTFTPPERVWEAIASLDPFREQAIPQLRERFTQSAGVEKLQVGFALERFGQPIDDFLTKQTLTIPENQAENLLIGLHLDRDRNAMLVSQNYQALRPQGDAEQLARLATIALDLDEVKPVITHLQAEQDPQLRTEFIDHFQQWNSNLKPFIDLLATTENMDIRYGLILALGTMQSDQIPNQDCSSLVEKLKHHFLIKDDTGVHNAAGWALRNWGIDLPPVGHTTAYASSNHWLVDQVGIKMVRVPAGQFQRSDGGKAATVKKMSRSLSDSSQKVVLSRDVFISCCEITLQQYRQFTHETGFVDPSRPSPRLRHQAAQQSQQVNSGSSSMKSAGDQAAEELLPVNDISWVSAAAFCNWLSQKHQLQRVYRKGDKGKYTADLAADGYRLPTEAEWEYATRAGASTMYFFGDQSVNLNRYAAPLKGDLFQVGLFMPNRFGIHDSYGNVAEWCHDYYGSYGSGSLTDPAGPQSGTQRIIRGGSIDDTNGSLCSGTRASEPEDYRSPYLGFRVACLPPSEK